MDQPTGRAKETFAMLKPSGVRHLGDIISAVNSRNEIVLIDMHRIDQPPREVLEEHYAAHEGKPFYKPLVEDMLKGPLVPMVWGLRPHLEEDESADATSIMRKYVGPTDPVEGDPSFHLRANYGIVDPETPQQVRMRNNVIHAADGLEAAVREIGIWFPNRATQRTSSGLYVPKR